jgi:hypothetical protein
MDECVTRAGSVSARHATGERGGSGHSWRRCVGCGAVLALLLLSVIGVTPGVASAATGSATLTELSGEEMQLNVSVTEDCSECFWFGTATVYPASSECPPAWESTGRAWVQKGEVSHGPVTVSQTETVNRFGLEGPLIVCVYVFTEGKSELVGRSGPFDPKPPQPPPPPPPPPPSATGSATLTELSGEEMQLNVSLTEPCSECVWFGGATVYSANADCPPTFQVTGRSWVQAGPVREGPGTVFQTERVNRFGIQGPLVVCIYVSANLVDELVGRSGPFDPQPPPPPASSPPPPPPSSPAPHQSLTRAKKLTKALQACRKKPKRKRKACERRARKLYGHTHH